MDWTRRVRLRLSSVLRAITNIGPAMLTRRTATTISVSIDALTLHADEIHIGTRVKAVNLSQDLSQGICVESDSVSNAVTITGHPR